MIESTTIQMLKEMFVAETMKKLIRKSLLSRFGSVSDEVLSQIESLEDENRLEELIKKSITCPSLEAFVECL